jgi:hypothetical protein
MGSNSPQAFELYSTRNGRWNYSLQTGDDGTITRVLAKVGGEERSVLWLSCYKASDEGENRDRMVVAAAITQPTFLGPSDGRGRSTVYWVDQHPPEVAQWVYRDRGGLLVGEQAVMALMASLATAEKLTVELANYRLETQNVSFSLQPGETHAIAERFSKDCRTIAARG